MLAGGHGSLEYFLEEAKARGLINENASQSTDENIDFICACPDGKAYFAAAAEVQKDWYYWKDLFAIGLLECFGSASLLAPAHTGSSMQFSFDVLSGIEAEYGRDGVAQFLKCIGRMQDIHEVAVMIRQGRAVEDLHPPNRHSGHYGPEDVQVSDYFDEAASTEARRIISELYNALLTLPDGTRLFIMTSNSGLETDTIGGEVVLSINRLLKSPPEGRLVELDKCNISLVANGARIRRLIESLNTLPVKNLETEIDPDAASFSSAVAAHLYNNASSVQFCMLVAGIDPDALSFRGKETADVLCELYLRATPDQRLAFLDAVEKSRPRDPAPGLHAIRTKADFQI